MAPFSQNFAAICLCDSDQQPNGKMLQITSNVAVVYIKSI